MKQCFPIKARQDKDSTLYLKCSTTLGVKEKQLKEGLLFLSGCKSLVANEK